MTHWGNSREALQNGFGLNTNTLLMEQGLTGMTYPPATWKHLCACPPLLGRGGHSVLLPVQHSLAFKNTQDLCCKALAARPLACQCVACYSLWGYSVEAYVPIEVINTGAAMA